MKNLVFMFLIATTFLSCEKKEEPIGFDTAPEFVEFKVTDKNGLDLINNSASPILGGDITLEYLVDGQKIIAPSFGPIDKPIMPFGIHTFSNTATFDGKTLYLYPLRLPDKTSLISVSYLTIKNKSTFTIEVEFIKYGANSTNGKVWVNGVLLRESKAGPYKPITLVVN